MGRGDPLKNDPTYDYSPPKLDLVKYWADGTGHKDKSKTDILLLGVPQQRQKEPANKHGPVRRNFVYNDVRAAQVMVETFSGKDWRLNNFFSVAHYADATPCATELQ